MSAAEYAFLVLAAVGSVSAVAVVTARNVIHAALYLVVALASVAGVYLVLGAEFTAWVQVIIYVGAIVILFLFGLMLTRAPIGRDLLDNHQRPVAAAVGAGIFVGLVYLIQTAFPLGQATQMRSFQATTGIIGNAIFRGYVLPFEAISFLLLAALIGAIVLARKDVSP